MALYTQQNLQDWLGLTADVAAKVDTPLNAAIAKEEVRDDVSEDKYDEVESGQSAGSDEYDRIAQAEALHALASFIGNQGAIRMSEQGGLVQDLTVHNAETIRQLLSQGQTEAVQRRLRQQAKTVLGEDLLDPSATTWAI